MELITSKSTSVEKFITKEYKILSKFEREFQEVVNLVENPKNKLQGQSNFYNVDYYEASKEKLNFILYIRNLKSRFGTNYCSNIRIEKVKEYQECFKTIMQKFVFEKSSIVEDGNIVIRTQNYPKLLKTIFEFCEEYQSFQNVNLLNNLTSFSKINPIIKDKIVAFTDEQLKLSYDKLNGFRNYKEFVKAIKKLTSKNLK